MNKQYKQKGIFRKIISDGWKSYEMKISVTILLIILIMTVFSPILFENDPVKINIKDKFLPPFFMETGSLKYIFGTDQLGRDLFVRSLVGLKNAFVIAFLSTVGMFLLGCLIGIISGYYGKFTDTVLMRITDIQMSIPVIILAITILGISRPNAFLIIIVLVLAGWPVYSRVSRSAALAEKEKEYVRAAKILGASNPRILFFHIAPVILPPIAFVSILDIARMMIFEAIFGFIGIGVQPPTPTFGTIISSGSQYLINYWWITVVPGFLLVLTLTCLNLIGGVLERSRNKILAGN